MQAHVIATFDSNSLQRMSFQIVKGTSLAVQAKSRVFEMHIVAMIMTLRSRNISFIALVSL